MKKYNMVKFALQTAVILLLGLSLATAGCAKGKTATTSTTTAKVPVYGIALLTDLTGPTSEPGRQIRNGVALAVDHLKAEGIKVNLDTQDTAGDQGQAVALLKKVAANSSNVAAIGPVRGVELIAMVPHLLDLKILLTTVTAGASAPLNKWWFRTIPPNETTASAVVEGTYKQLNIKKLGIVYAPDDDSLKATKEGFEAGAKRSGIDVVAREAYKTGDTDFSAQLTKLRNIEMDALALSANPNIAGPMVLQASRIGLKLPTLGGAGFLDAQTLHKLSQGTSNGTLVATAFMATDKSPRIRAFNEAYASKYKEDPSAYAAYAYDTMMLQNMAIQKAGSTDRAAIRDVFGTLSKIELISGALTVPPEGGDIARDFLPIAAAKNGTLIPLEEALKEGLIPVKK